MCMCADLAEAYMVTGQATHTLAVLYELALHHRTVDTREIYDGLLWFAQKSGVSPHVNSPNPAFHIAPSFLKLLNRLPEDGQIPYRIKDSPTDRTIDRPNNDPISDYPFHSAGNSNPRSGVDLETSLPDLRELLASYIGIIRDNQANFRSSKPFPHIQLSGGLEG